MGSIERHQLPVALDAMGGDHGVAPNVSGAVEAVRLDGARVILVGDEHALRDELVRLGADPLLREGLIRVQHAPDTVAMDEKPALAARKKKTSSMRVACDLVVHGDAIGALSAGNSGAMMATALLAFGRIDGVLRPAIGSTLPSFTTSGHVHLVDAGANVECEAIHLAQWAVLGATYVAHMDKIERPRVGIVANGEEDSKGTELTRAALELVKCLAGPLHFEAVGYVEGRDLNHGAVDVVVTDGFTGNVMLKTAEGVFRFVSEHIRRGYAEGSIAEKAGGALSKSVFARVRQRLDPREYGAAPLLGLAHSAFIAHGRSDAYAIRRGLRAVRTSDGAALVQHMRDAIGLAHTALATTASPSAVAGAADVPDASG